MPTPSRHGRVPACLPVSPRVTVLVPAYNERDNIAQTLASLQIQTRPPDRVLVVDDCSTDDTGTIAAEMGAEVVRPPHNTGFKAGAQRYGLQFIDTELLLAIDADTTLAPDAVEKLLAALDDPTVAAACGFVLPRQVRTIWERGRYAEYLFAFTFGKAIQEHYGRPMIASGCFTVYRTDVLRSVGGWQPRTVAEDLDLTWTLYEHGHTVRFVTEAVCYPIEPATLSFFYRQVRRWTHGFFQNLRLHWRPIVEQPYLRSMVAVGLWDASLAAVVYLLLLPLLALLVHPLFLLGYVIDAPVVAVPVLMGAARRGEIGRALLSLPGFFVVRLANAILLVEAAWSELLMRRPLAVFEKGH